MKRILKIVGISVGAFFIVCLLGFSIIWFTLNAHFLDYPYVLADQEQTIELMYMAWACDCAEWAQPKDVHLYNDNSNDTLASLSIFIEAGKPGLNIPEEYQIGCCGNRIRFTGKFYKERGISRDYEIQFEKPDKARVFRYTSYELVKPYTAWDFNAPDSSDTRTKIIK